MDSTLIGLASIGIAVIALAVAWGAMRESIKQMKKDIGINRNNITRLKDQDSAAIHKIEVHLASIDAAAHSAAENTEKAYAITEKVANDHETRLRELEKVGQRDGGAR